MAQFNSSLPDHGLSGWKQLYEAAILELDYGKLLTRIADARSAINDRATEAIGDSALAEHKKLNDALHTLKILEEVAIREKNAA